MEIWCKSARNNYSFQVAEVDLANALTLIDVLQGDPPVTFALLEHSLVLQVEPDHARTVTLKTISTHHGTYSSMGPVTGC